MENGPSRNPGKVFGSTAISLASHLFGTLTCATCWAIFGPSLALVFGTSGTAFLAAARPYAPLLLALSAVGIAYSIHQLLKTPRDRADRMPYKLARLFNAVSAIGWAGSATYSVITFLKG